MTAVFEPSVSIHLSFRLPGTLQCRRFYRNNNCRDFSDGGTACENSGKLDRFGPSDIEIFDFFSRAR